MVETAFSLERAGKLFQPQTKTSCLYFRIKADNQNNLILRSTRAQKSKNL